MNWLQSFVREAQLWRHYPGDRIRWFADGRESRIATRSFELAGRSYPYFVHPYNHTWENERAVELPVAIAFIRGTATSDVLEIGNVLSHYIDARHMVVDRYERCFYRRVTNEDFLTFKPDRRFKRIVALSTFEHIGWDESPRDPPKFLRAVKHLRSLLTEDGEALITVPIGYNTFVDECLTSGSLGAARTDYLSRYSKENEWRVTEGAEALSRKYGHPFPCANALAYCWLSSLSS